MLRCANRVLWTLQPPAAVVAAQHLFPGNRTIRSIVDRYRASEYSINVDTTACRLTQQTLLHHQHTVLQTSSSCDQRSCQPLKQVPFCCMHFAQLRDYCSSSKGTAPEQLLLPLQQQLPRSASSVMALCQQAAVEPSRHHRSRPASQPSISHKHSCTAESDQPHSGAENRHRPVRKGIATTSSSSSIRESNAGSDTDEVGRSQVPTQPSSSSDLLGKWRMLTCKVYGGLMSWIFLRHMVNPEWSSWGLMVPREVLEPEEMKYNILRKLLATQDSGIFTGLLSCQYALWKPLAVPMLQLAHEELSTDDSITELKSHLSMAVRTVLELYAKDDLDALEHMVASERLSLMSDHHFLQMLDVEREDLAVTEMMVEVRKVDIVCFQAMNFEQVSNFVDYYGFKEQVADSNIKPADHALWDVVHVYVEADWKVALKNIMFPWRHVMVTLPKRGYWVFCRGPVQFDQKIPADADLPWFVLTWL